MHKISSKYYLRKRKRYVYFMTIAIFQFLFDRRYILDKPYNNTGYTLINNSEETAMATGYCVKCKEKGVDLTAPEIHQTAKGGFMAKGKHEKCGTTVCAMMSKDNAEKEIEAGAKKAY